MWIDLLIINNFSLFRLETKTIWEKLYTKKTAISNHFVSFKKFANEKRTYVNKGCNLLISYVLTVLCHYPLMNYPDKFIWKKLLSKGCLNRKIVWWISWWTNKTDFFWCYEPDSLQVWWKTRATKNWKLVNNTNYICLKKGLFF